MIIKGLWADSRVETYFVAAILWFQFWAGNIGGTSWFPLRNNLYEKKSILYVQLPNVSDWVGKKNYFKMKPFSFFYPQ